MDIMALMEWMEQKEELTPNEVVMEGVSLCRSGGRAVKSSSYFGHNKQH
jgi:hypothetical protein